MSTIIDGTNGITVPTPITVPNGGTGATTSTGTGSVALSSSPTITTPTIARINSTSSNTPTLFYDNSGNQIGTLCRAWVYFNPSSGTAIINASFNVSSVTRTSSGLYTINFTNPMPDANYATFVANCAYNSNNTDVHALVQGNGASGPTLYSTTQVGVLSGYTGSNTLYDTGFLTVSVFR